jgi:hypothetical protein
MDLILNLEVSYRDVSCLIALRRGGVVALNLKFLVYNWCTGVQTKWSYDALTVGAAHRVCEVLT